MPTPQRRQSLDDLLAAFDRGKRRAIAQVLTRLEQANGGRDLIELVAALRARAGGACLIGVTGPPGAGKSTLVNRLAERAREQGRRVAIIAIDPSSPVSGGAILGDRIRMTAATGDDGVYVRSLASSGHLGGLTPAAIRIIDGLDAAGFDLIILETVGTGQNEIDIAQVGDVQVVVAAPGLGDGIQAMKAGLLEIADIMVVNKADRGGADHTREQLMGALSLRADGGAHVPVLTASAATGAGVGELMGGIDERCARLNAESAQSRRARRARYLLSSSLQAVVMRRLSQPESQAEIDTLADALIDGRVSAQEAVRRLFAPRS